jgi:hypothetical protein
VRDALDRHLDALATRMGGFLRGFDNPRVHLGSAARFAVEFRKITCYPALHPPGEGRAISYSEAAGLYRAPHIDRVGEKPADPIFTMIHALGGQSTLSAGIRREFPLDRLRRDVVRLLRVPLLLFYLQVSDRASFFAALDEVAEKGGFPLAKGARGSAMVCPGCGSTLSPGSDRSARRCTSCGQV